MAYQLYSYNSRLRQPVSFKDLDDKPFWCKHGEKQEEAFIKRMSMMDTTYSVSIHPEKKNNPYHPDLLIKYKDQTFVGEVKIKNSPLFYAKNQYGVDNQFGLTMDLKDSFNYNNLLQDGLDLVIFIWVSWDAHEMARVVEKGSKKFEQRYFVRPMEGIWVTRFSKLREFETSEKPPIHWYKESFRKPKIYQQKDHALWCEKLLNFEPRLKQSAGRVKNITANSYTSENGSFYPTGHSSGSYVFDLQNEVFKELVCEVG